MKQGKHRDCSGLAGIAAAKLQDGFSWGELQIGENKAIPGFSRGRKVGANECAR